MRYLIDQGVDLDGESIYHEFPLGVAYRFNGFDVVKALIEAGANEERLLWTPLIRAIAIGTDSEVEAELANPEGISARDALERSALDVALLRGNLDLAKHIRPHVGAIDDGRPEDSLLCLAAAGGNTEAVEWLAAEGVPIDSRDEMGHTALADAAGRGDVPMMELLLSLGADPNAEINYSSVLEEATTGDAVRLLLEHGANPQNMKDEERRLLLGLGEANADLLHKVTRDEYLAGRYPAETKSNPEETTAAFRIAMIRAGISAYGAREYFEDPASFACGLDGNRPPAVWCAARFGQSLTMLPDGRTILIGGEHEDHYDPDFCIYNDVIVFHSDGDIQIFGYPYAVFPPTDFHTATLIGTDVYILGALGYMGERQSNLPVYRLSTLDYRIEPVQTTGRVPGRVYRHRSILEGDHTIRIEGGTHLSFPEGGEVCEPNTETYRLDLRTLVWS